MYNIMHKAFSQSTIAEADPQARTAPGGTASIGRTRDGFAWTPERIMSGLPTKAVLPSKMTKQNYDVIVIGAGFAGLTAARDISQKSQLNVLLLEARDRIGGRTWTTNAFGMDFEMGGTWVHWYQPHVWSEIDRYDLSKSLKESVTSTTMYIRTAEGSIVQAPKHLLTSRMEELEALFFAVDGHDAQTLMPYPMDPFREPALWKAYDHLTVRDRIDQLRATKVLSDDEVIALEALNSGASLNRAEYSPFTDALRWYALAGYSIAGISATSAHYKIGDGGMTTLARRMLNDYTGDILFDAVVSEIDQNIANPRALQIYLKDGQRLSASMVISTIPLNVLESIKFTPPLSDLRNEGIEIGHINYTTKVHFKLAELVEPYNTASAHESDAIFATGVCDNPDPSDSRLSSHVVGFTFNKSITNIKNSEDMIDNFNKDLQLDPENQVAGYIVHDWTNDPFSKGAWCSLPPGSDSRYRQEFQKPHGRILFASGDWADGWMGFIDGAIEQGKRAAVQVLAANKAR